jgi:hypothetical protein
MLLTAVQHCSVAMQPFTSWLAGMLLLLLLLLLQPNSRP